jgi:hypothetical protein
MKQRLFLNPIFFRTAQCPNLPSAIKHRHAHSLHRTFFPSPDGSHSTACLLSFPRKRESIMLFFISTFLLYPRPSNDKTFYSLLSKTVVILNEVKNLSV